MTCPATVTTTCGTGASCEKVCPLMRAGRDCPGLEAFFAELQSMSSSATRRSTRSENLGKSSPTSSKIANSVEAFI